MSDGREQWSSRLGFIMAAAGSAVGLGNIWRFPYLAGINGGGIFLLLYLLMVAVIGMPVMLAEMAIGRGGGLNAVGSFRKLKGGLWPMVGWAGVVAGFVILSFYGVVAGWTVAYMVKSFGSLMPQALAGNAEGLFKSFTMDWRQQVAYQGAFMLATIWIVYKGIGNGIERYCKVMMPMLFVILSVLMVRSLTLEGAMKGVEFYLKPDFSKMSSKTVLDALGQAFFSLSVGMGCMITYGSYLGNRESLPYSVTVVTVMDVAVAILVGFVIFPAVFAFGMEPTSGPGLIFITLPAVFARMPMGSAFSFLFFLLLFFAAITSSVSLLEVCVAYFKDEFRWDRAKASWILGFATFLLGIPSALSLGGHFPKVFGMDFMGAMDFLASNVLLPLGGIFISIFAGWSWFEGARDEVRRGGRLPKPLEAFWVFSCRVLAPIAVTWVFIGSIR
ncbi:MAG: sodium-dependent transporter [Thermanaerothrix sp.]|nr:sodium-dependent transporter [Thermanaerothrix sp.]